MLNPQHIASGWSTPLHLSEKHRCGTSNLFLHVPTPTAASRRCGDRRLLKVENLCGALQLASQGSYSSASYLSGTTPSQRFSVARTEGTRADAGQAVADRNLTSNEHQYEDEYEARQAVLNYLQSEGIETAELQNVGLPTSVAIMEERLTFLRKIGLATEDINSYPLMVACSVKRNLVPVLSYLEKLNVEARDLPAFIRRHPMVLSSSVVMDLEPIVSFLLGLGIERTNLGRVLCRFPDILGFKIEGTMSTSVAYLVSLGVNMREIGPMITEYPEILGMRVGNNIKPKADFLLSLGIPKESLAKILEVKPFVLGFELEDTMKPAIQDLLDLGVREEFVARVLIQYADVLGLKPKERMDAKMDWLTKHAGVKHEDVGRVLEKLPQILAINIPLAQSRLTFLTDNGFSVEDVGFMVTNCPQILALSIDGVLKPNLDFYLKNVTRPLTELVNFPVYFTYNLETRIRPRYIQIEQKGIHCSLPWFLNCSDATFAARLVLDFVDRPDEEQEEVANSMEGRVRIKGQSSDMLTSLEKRGISEEQLEPFARSEENRKKNGPMPLDSGDAAKTWEVKKPPYIILFLEE